MTKHKNDEELPPNYQPLIADHEANWPGKTDQDNTEQLPADYKPLGDDHAA